ncbi:MAG: hypothetical protein ACR2FG_08240 [Marmoricola sp.]
MVDLAGIRGLRGGHLFFGLRHLGLTGLLIVLAVIIVLVILSNRRR